MFSNIPSILSMTLLLSAHVSIIHSENICSLYCDGRDPGLATNPRSPVSTTLWGREISLEISDVDNMAYGKIANGDPGDQLWIDRSFDGGKSWSDNSRLGDTTIPENARETKTLMYNVDGVISQQQIGALRACGQANNRDEIACTLWARSTQLAGTRIDAAATALMQFYNSEGVFSENGWWTSANGLTAIIDYTKLVSKVYEFTIDYTFEKNKGKQWGNFTNDYIDDVGWWGLAWVDAFDVTGNQKYLDMAKIDADFMYATWDDVCGGGIYWKTDANSGKNAIPNELYIKLGAALHNRIPGDTKYLNEALNVWNWFESVGVINSENLINDGINTHTDCKNNGDTTWTYNQGVILGGMAELHKATGDNKYLDQARRIADAVIASPLLNPNGILKEPCEHDGCGADGPTFKGVFVRNLGELNRALEGRPYSGYLDNLADVVYSNRNELDQYGLHYAGPFEYFSSSSQQSAFEVFVAAIR